MSDYGNPDDPHDFDFIHPYSPLHNVPTDKVFPPTLLTTADRKLYDTVQRPYAESYALR